jgi:hypothetical protein
LKKEVNKDTGLMTEISYLLPLLNTGLTTEDFNLVAKIPVERYLLRLYVKEELTNGAPNFKFLTEI